MEVESRGYIEFRAPKGSKSKSPSAGKIKGDVKMYFYEGTFKGLKRTPLTPVRGKQYPKDTAWEIESLIGDPDTQAGDCMGEFLNVVYLSDAKDDKGNHFLVLDWTEGPGCHGVTDGFCIGHKSRWEPDEEELEKLGIGLSNEEVEMRAKAGAEFMEEVAVGSSSEEDEDQERAPGKRGAGKASTKNVKRRKITSVIISTAREV